MDLRDCAGAIKKFGQAIGISVKEAMKLNDILKEFYEIPIQTREMNQWGPPIVKHPPPEPPKRKIEAIFVGGPKDGEGMYVPEAREIFEIAEYEQIPIDHYPKDVFRPPSLCKIFTYRAYYIGDYQYPDLIVYYDKDKFPSMQMLLKHLVMNYIGERK